MDGAIPISLPMFPIGGVVLPGTLVPLHVFEPRYRALVHHCLAGDRRFGMVLIERGSEVGGGDTRTALGVTAEITEAAELAGGRWLVVARGLERVRVRRWLDEDPYPQAEVEIWPDAGPEADPGPTIVRLRRALALAAELDQDVAPATFRLVEDPTEAAYQIGALAPIGPADRFDVLAAPGCASRLHLLDQLLDDQIDLLRHRLAGTTG